MDKTKEPEKDGCSVPTIQSLSSLLREKAWLTQFAIPLQPLSYQFQRKVGGGGINNICVNKHLTQKM